MQSFAEDSSVVLENGRLQYANIVSVKQAKELTPGQTIQTRGYNRKNDDGGATYVIRKKNVSDIDDGGGVIFLDNGNVAILIVDSRVNVKQFGAVGDGLTDDTQAIQNAVNYISRRSGGIVFFPIGQYKVSDTLTVNNSHVKIKGIDKTLSVLRPTADLIVDSEKYLVKWTLAIVNDNKVIETRLKGKTNIGKNSITVVNSTGVVPGMLMYIRGDFLTSPWTSNNRGKAVKGETNKVLAVKGNTIFLSKPMSTNFDIKEDVSIRFVQPLEGIEISSLGVSCPDDCPEDKRQYRGFTVSGCDHAVITDCYGNGCGTSCFESIKSYKTIIKNNIVKNAWSYKRDSTTIYGLGYGLRATSDSLTEIINNKAEECRHCVDISGGYPAHEVLVANNIFTSEVSRYGVMSTHGPAEGCVFENNVAEGPVSILMRGENNIVKNNTLKGKIFNYYGRNNRYEHNSVFGGMTFRQEDTIEDTNFNIIRNNTFYIKSNSLIYLISGTTPYNSVVGWTIEDNDIVLLNKNISLGNVYLCNIGYSKSKFIDFNKGFKFRNNNVRNENNDKAYPLKICSDMNRIKLSEKNNML